MEIKMSIVVETPEHELDGHYGLESLKGSSDSLCIATETILKKRVPGKITHKNPVRTKLKSTFKSSFGLNLTIEVKDKELSAEVRRMGKEVLAELVGFFIKEALYLQAPQLSDAAQKLVQDMDDLREDLSKRLREPLKDMHQVPKIYGHALSIRYMKPGDPRVITRVDEHSARNITESRLTEQVETLIVGITRFNAFTGNGRFQIVGQYDTQSFGFGSQVLAVRIELRKLISKNLDSNNGKPQADWKLLRITVTKVVLPNNEVVKYIIKGAEPVE